MFFKKSIVLNDRLELVMKKTIIFIILFSLTSCVTYKALTLEQIKALPHKKLESHSVNLNKKIIDRIVSAPPVILDYLKRLDNTDKYIPYELNASEKKLFLEYYEILPPKYKDIIEKKVIAIYFIKNFTGGGMADVIFDKNGTMYIALYFNSQILNKSLSDWITYRDNSSFTDEGKKISIELNCKQGYFGLLHTIIHETSHIYDFYNHNTPFVVPFLKNNDQKHNSEFTFNIWRDYFHPEEMYEFPNRKSVTAYGLGKKLDKTLSFDLYKNLNKSPFSSLYGSKNWAEDFAETFTWYYLNYKLNIKYIVNISQDGKESVKFSPTDNELVKKRYKIFESIVK